MIRERCAWAEQGDELERTYHDTEWGVPVHDDQRLFEFICLEGAQAGLSWRTILSKRNAYRELFHNFDITKVANMGDDDLESILQNPRIIRNHLKVYAFRKNARAAQKIIKKWGGLDAYLWSFTDGASRETGAEIPVTTPASDAMSKQMKKDGFTFIGSTICYALMQAIGIVNDHEVNCFRYKEVS